MMSIMEQTQKIQAMGTSHGIVIPKGWLKAQNLKKGDVVSVSIFNDRLVIKRVKK